ncbi:MAG: hypothetical protein JW751_19275 [Polyangiaceae bacterium]|nr:hypothetical protein [Polyangiaceae bacterium]
MNVTLLLVLVVFFAFAVGHLVTRFASRFVRLTGVEFVLVGVLIGPHFAWELMTVQALAQLDPLISLLLGLAGFVLGLRFRLALHRVDAAAASLTSTLLTIVGTSLLLLAAMVWLAPEQPGSAFVIDQPLLRFRGYVLELHFTSAQLWIAVVLGCAASVASTAAIDGVCQHARAAGPVSSLLRVGGIMAEVVAVFVLGLAMSTARATGTATYLDLTIVEWGVASILAAVVSGLLFGLFIGRERDPDRVFLATVGLVTFASGVGAALGISPLFINLLAGVTVAATSPHAEPVRLQLDRLHHPIFVVLMVLAGAQWSPPPASAWALPGVYLLGRIALRHLTTPPSVSIFLETVPRTRRLGAGLLSQGILAVAIGLYAAQRFPEARSIILTTVLVGALASDLFSDRSLRKVLIDAGEAGRETSLEPGVATAAAEVEASCDPVRSVRATRIAGRSSE